MEMGGKDEAQTCSMDESCHSDAAVHGISKLSTLHWSEDDVCASDGDLTIMPLELNAIWPLFQCSSSALVFD